MVKVVDKACAQKFQDSLLLCPKAGECEVGKGRRKNELHLLGAHGVADQTILCLSDALDVQAARTIADKASHRLPAMTDAEVNIRMLLQDGLLVFIIGKGRHALNAKTEAKPPQQFHIAHGTLSPTLQMLVPPRCFATPFRQRGYEPFRLSLTQILNMVVDAENVPNFHQRCELTFF